jgi:hypothetical protein
MFMLCLGVCLNHAWPCQVTLNLRSGWSRVYTVSEKENQTFNCSIMLCWLTFCIHSCRLYPHKCLNDHIKSLPHLDKPIAGLRADSHRIPSPKSLEVNPCNLNHWEHGSWDFPLHMGSQVLSPKYDMHAYMATLFEGEAWDLCCELGRAKNWTQLSTQLPQIFVHKKNQDPTLTIN